MLRHCFGSALRFAGFLEQAQGNAARWRDTSRLARVPADAAARLAALPGRWHLLAIVEDWCGDAANTVPLLARLVRTWYARDRGRATVDEVVDVVARAAERTGVTAAA